MDITFNANGILETESPLVYDGGNIAVSITGTFTAGDYVMQFRRGNLIVSTTALSVDMTGTIATEFLETEFDLVRKNRIALEIVLLKDDGEIGAGIITCKRESQTDLVSEPTTGTPIAYAQKQIVKANPDTGVLVSPSNLFTANAETIYNAIESLIQIPDGGSDNLGNHTATQDLNLDAHKVTNATGIDLITGYVYLGDTAYPETKSIAYSGNKLKFGTDAIYHAGNPPPAPDLSGYVETGDNVSSLTNDAGYITLADIPPAVAELKLSVPFNYMQLSKCFTTGLLGWDTIEVINSGGQFFSAGGYYSTSASLQNGTAYIDLPIPAGATGFANVGALEFLLFGNSVNSAETKYDLNIYLISAETGKITLRLETNNVLDSTSVITIKSYAKSDFVNAWNSAFNSATKATRRLVLEFEFYSKSSKYIYLLGGSANLIG